MARYSNVWPIVMDKTLVDSTTACTTKWSDVKDQLSDVCGATTLGNGFFGFALKAVLSDQVHAAILQVMEEVLKKPDHVISEEDVLKAKRKALERIEGIKGIAGLMERREISFKYRTMFVTAKVSCLGEHIDMMVWGYIEGLAVFREQLTPIQAENQLAKGSDTAEAYPAGLDVETDLVAEADCARQHLNKMCELAKVKDPAGLQVGSQEKQHHSQINK